MTIAPSSAPSLRKATPTQLRAPKRTSTCAPGPIGFSAASRRSATAMTANQPIGKTTGHRFLRVPNGLDQLVRNSPKCRPMKLLTIPGEQKTEGGLAQAKRLFQHRIKHWRQLPRRAIYDL